MSLDKGWFGCGQQDAMRDTFYGTSLPNGTREHCKIRASYRAGWNTERLSLGKQTAPVSLFETDRYRYWIVGLSDRGQEPIFQVSLKDAPEPPTGSGYMGFHGIEYLMRAKNDKFIDYGEY